MASASHGSSCARPPEAPRGKRALLLVAYPRRGKLTRGFGISGRDFSLIPSSSPAYTSPLSGFQLRLLLSRLASHQTTRHRNRLSGASRSGADGARDPPCVNYDRSSLVRRHCEAFVRIADEGCGNPGVALACLAGTWTAGRNGRNQKGTSANLDCHIPATPVGAAVIRNDAKWWVGRMGTDRGRRIAENRVRRIRCGVAPAAILHRAVSTVTRTAGWAMVCRGPGGGSASPV